MDKTCQHSARPGFDDHATAEDGPAENEGDAASMTESDISDLSPIDLLGGDRLDAIELEKTKNHAKMRETADDGGIFVVRGGVVGRVEDAKDIATEMARDDTPTDDGGIFVVRNGVISQVEDARDIPMEIARQDAKTEASSGLSQLAETEPPKHSSRYVPTSIECRIKLSTAIETVLTEWTSANSEGFEGQILLVEEKEPSTAANSVASSIPFIAQTASAASDGTPAAMYPAVVRCASVGSSAPSLAPSLAPSTPPRPPRSIHQQRNKRGVVRHLPDSLSWSICRRQSTASF